MFLGFAYSHFAKSNSLILSRDFKFVRNVLLNFYKDNGDKEQLFCFMKNHGLINLFSEKCLTFVFNHKFSNKQYGAKKISVALPFTTCKWFI